MNNKLISLLILGYLFISCQQKQRQHEELVTIDVTQDYPEKEILLSDIADINYMQLDETEDDYLYKGTILRISDNYIIVFDDPTGNILFFSKDGTPKSKFNRKGNGPGEYIHVLRSLTWYDEAKDNLYVKNHNKVDIFSSTGDYKHSFPLAEGLDVTEMFLLVDNSLLFFDMSAEMKYTYEHFNLEKETAGNEQTTPQESLSSFFVRFNLENGDELNRFSLPKDYQVDLTLTFSGFGMSVVRNASMNHIVKHPEGVLLHTQETDTVFLYNARQENLTPVMVQTPSLPTLAQPSFLNTYIETDKYQFIEFTRLDKEKEDYFSTYLLYDKSEGRIYKQKVILDDFPEKEIFISASLASGTQNAHEILIELTIDELMDAYKKNQLKGRLREMAASMNEESENNVLILLKLK